MRTRILGATEFDGIHGYQVTEGGSWTFGSQVTAIDLDRDGSQELVISAPNYPSYPSRGLLSIFWSGPYIFPPTFESSGYLFGDCKGFTIEGGVCDGEIGYKTATGDIDGDGNAELIFLAFDSCNAGLSKIYAFRGGSRASFTSMTLDAFTSAHGYKFTDIPQASSLKVADLNNDSIADIVLLNLSNEYAAIIWGKLNGFSPVTSVPALTSGQISKIFGAGPVSQFAPTGFATSAAIDDFNGDGKTDIVITAPYGFNGTGGAYGFLDASTLLTQPRNASQSDFQIRLGFNDGLHRGLGSAAFAGDITGDKFAEMILCGSAFQVQPDQSRIYNNYCVTIFGKSAIAPVFNVSTMTPADGFSVYRGTGLFASSAPTCLGAADAIAVVDTTGDGIADLLLGDYCAFPGPLGTNGSLTIIHGRYNQTSFQPVYDPSQLQSSEGWEWKGTQSSSFAAALTAGDFDGDRIPDIAVGEPIASKNLMVPNSVYVTLSSATKTSIPTCLAPPTSSRIPTSAGSRVSPALSLIPELIAFGQFVSKQLPKSMKNAMLFGSAKGVSTNVEYAMSLKGVSYMARSVTSKVVYYGSAYVINYCNRYSELAASNISEVEKSTTAAYQAASDTGMLLLTDVALKACSTACYWLGGMAESSGWTRTSSALNWVGQHVGYGSYAYQAGRQGVIEAACSIGSGAVAEKVVGSVGKLIVDSCVTPDAAYRKSSEAKLTLFSSKPTKQAVVQEPPRQLAAAGRLGK